MGHNNSKLAQSSQQPAPVQQLVEPPPTPGFGRAQTMLDVSQAQLAVSSETPGLPRSNSDTQLNNSAAGKSYQRALEWGRNEHFFKLAHTFHTNNY